MSIYIEIQETNPLRFKKIFTISENQNDLDTALDMYEYLKACEEPIIRIRKRGTKEILRIWSPIILLDHYIKITIKEVIEYYNRLLDNSTICTHKNLTGTFNNKKEMIIECVICGTTWEIKV